MFLSSLMVRSIQMFLSGSVAYSKLMLLSTTLIRSCLYDSVELYGSFNGNVTVRSYDSLYNHMFLSLFMVRSIRLLLSAIVARSKDMLLSLMMTHSWIMILFPLMVHS